MRADRITVVLPTYNERQNLKPILEAVTQHGYNCLVVDDGSPDGTGDLADRVAATNALVSVLHRDTKEGLGPAYIAGFDTAIAAGAEVVVEMDADFSHDPADLPRLVGAIDDGAELVIGSRYVPGGETPGWPWHRKAISRGGNLYARMMLGLSVNDATAGFRAFQTSALVGLDYSSARASGYAFQVEMAWRASRARLRITEVPVTFKDREIGVSKMGGAIVLEAMWLVTRWGFGRIFGRKGQLP